MNYVRLLTYVICTTAFASVVTFIDFMKPRGPQPARYSHIQTIAHAIDDWTFNDDKNFDGEIKAAAAKESGRRGGVATRNI